MTEARLALIIDDSQDQLDLLQRMLEREGFQVFAAIDAESAIAVFEEISPVIAIVDLILPGVTGAEVLSRIRSRFPACALVVSSVLDVIEYPEADAALPKPVTGTSLHEAIMKVAA